MAELKPLSDVCAAVLSRNRETLNARFRAAQARRPIDGDAFLEHVRGVVAPCVDAVHAIDADATERVLHALYDLSLELFGTGLLGPEQRSTAVDDAWRRLLPGLRRLLRIDPRRVTGAMTNAIVNVSQHVSEWTRWNDLMIAIAPLLTDVDLFLQSGRVAAWLSGVAHHRAAALRALEGIDPQIAARLLGVEPEGVANAVRGLAADRWFVPSRPDEPRTTRLVGKKGAFSGFGGRFIDPPIVSAIGDHIVVTSRESSWTLHADAFGTTLVPLRGPVAQQPTTTRVALPKAPIPELVDQTSSAAADGVLAVTLRYSHAVHVIGIA